MKIWTSILIVVFINQITSATIVNVEFINEKSGKIIQVYGGEYNWNSVYAGTYNLLIDNKNAVGISVDLNQHVSYLTQEYNVVDFKKVPNPGKPMGSLKSVYVEEMFQRFYSPKLNSVEASAFQCAIWELIYEDYKDSPSLYDVSKDNSNGKNGFACKNIDYELANKWIYELDGDEHPFCNTGIMALSCRNFQDYAVSIPEPATIIILGIGFTFCLIKGTYGK